MELTCLLVMVAASPTVLFGLNMSQITCPSLSLTSRLVEVPCFPILMTSLTLAKSCDGVRPVHPATSSNAIVQGATGPGAAIPVASVDEQVADFITSPPSNISLENPLFVLLAGANDPLFDPNVTASQSFQVIQSSKAALSAKYPTAQILFLAYPDLARLPVGFYLDAHTKRQLTTFTKELAALYNDARLQAARAGERFAYVDLRALFEDFEYYASPAEYGFAPLGKYGSCLTGVYGETEEVTVCDDADKMVYWDEYQ